MKSKKTYTILVSFTIILFAAIILFAKKPKKNVAGLKERIGTIASSAEWLNTKEVIKGLLATIEADPENYKAKLQLAQAYIQEARVTGDHAYYDKAALDLLEDVIKNDNKNFEAYCCKATVLLSQHHFSDGLLVAQQALPLNPYNGFVYGIMCDAQLELGNYSEAVKMADKMVSVRPDIRSYARVSYLREIYGDYKGAILAAKLAVSAGYPGLEQTEWTRTILAHLYENTGQLDSAAFQYKIALINRPDYAFANAGLGRIEKAKGNYKQAIVYFEKAKNTIVEYSFSDELTDLYYLNGDLKKSKESSEKVIEMLSPVSNADESETGHGHYADKELAYAFVKVPDYDKALEHAMLEYNRRPDNIDVCETVAWVNYLKGNYAEANKMINKAMRTKSNNPVLLCRAGLIKIQAGERKIGVDLITKAISINPFIADVKLKAEVSKYLRVV